MILRLLRAGLRRVFNLSFLAALSLLLGIGLGCLWVRSHRTITYLWYRSSGNVLDFNAAPWGLQLTLEIGSGQTTGGHGWAYLSMPTDPQGQRAYEAERWKESWIGFKVAAHVYRATDSEMRLVGVIHGYEATVPFWFPMVLTLIAPLCWLRRWRRQARRVRLGLCLHCGYDLRATPDAAGPRVARCPECGRLNNAA